MDDGAGKLEDGPHVPVIDLTPFLRGPPPARRALAAQVDRVNREIGFLVIQGHGFDLDLLAAWLDASRRFFERPAAWKAAFEPVEPGAHQGYHRMAASGLAAKEGVEAPPDLREYFMVGPLDTSTPQAEGAGRFHRPNLWPDAPEDFRSLGERYYRAMEALGRDLMRLFALALDLREDYFADRIGRHGSILSTIYYPPQREAPRPGQLRAGAHTDYGSLTILAQTDSTGGLQVRTRAGEWVGVPALPGTFVINIGDMMQRWTNDRWASNLHRVVNPPLASAGARQSVAYFLHPDHDAVIACIPTCAAPGELPRYPPILAGDYMLEKEASIASATAAKAVG